MSEPLYDPTVLEKYDVPEAFRYSLDEEEVTNEEISAVRRLVRENKIEQKGAFAAGIKYARQEIIALENDLGLVQKDERSMQVAVLPDAVFEKAYFDLTRQEAGDSGGGYANALGSVVLRASTDPAYIKSSMVYHEFVHKFIDKHIQVFSKVRRPSGRIAHDYVDRRSGLSVENVTKESSAKGTKPHGELLNELGNYMEQHRFILNILDKPEFAEEKQRREKLLRSMGFGESGGFWIANVKKQDGSTLQINLDRDSIHIDENGDFNPATLFFYMQLATDLGKACDPQNDGAAFRKLLLDCKVDPSKQNELRKMVDMGMGEGFYTRLKSAGYQSDDELLDLIVEVQSKL